MREVEEKRSGSLVATVDTSADLEDWRKYQQKILNTLDLSKKKACPHCHKGRKKHFYGKKESQSYRPNQKVMWPRATLWRERAGSKRELGVEKMRFTLKEDGFPR